MSGRPWYKRYGSDFIAGTLGMSLEEKGAYSIVLDLIYDRGGPIPDDARYIAGVCGCSVRRWNAIRRRLIDLGKITVSDTGISNSRADKELEIAAKTAEERAESGRKGGEKSAEKRDADINNKDLGQAQLEHTRAFQKPEARSQKEKEPSVPKSRGSRWPPGQPVPNEWLRWGREHFPDVEPRKIDWQARQFADYWPGADKGVKRDWPATWRNWLRRAFPGLERDDGDQSTPADLVVLPPDHPDFQAVERLRAVVGEAVIVGNRGTATFRRSEIEEARRAMQEQAA